MSRLWVTLEGVEGVGKTYIAQRLAQRLGPRCVLLNELTDQDAEGLPGQVVTALSQTGDVFLRTGHPLTETFALLALKVREYERLQSAGSGVDIVLEDRGVDSVAVYQAAILAGEGPLERMHALAQGIHAAAARWRPPPDLTVLLIDDLDTCERRFAERIGRPLREEERALMRQADQLYAWQAEATPARFVVMDRAGATEEETLARLQRTCLVKAGLGRQRCAT
jgi:dTMP kinase